MSLSAVPTREVRELLRARGRDFCAGARLGIRRGERNGAEVAALKLLAMLEGDSRREFLEGWDFGFDLRLQAAGLGGLISSRARRRVAPCS